MIILISVVTLIIIWVLLSDNKNKDVGYIENPDEVIFTSNKSVKEGVPNTIIFNYDLGSYQSDSAHIQLSWNPKERYKIEKENKFYTSTYYYPGYHNARLIIDDNVVKGHSVHITTDDWLTLVRYEPDDVLPSLPVIMFKLNNSRLAFAETSFSENTIIESI